jgi:hypothetical protein
MMAADFLKGIPFYFMGEFHQLKTFLDEKNKIDPARAITLKRVPGEFSLLNEKTGDKWQIKELGAVFNGRKNGSPTEPEPCFKIYKPQFGLITILLSECKVKETANV